jgi:hypothetical protein
LNTVGQALPHRDRFRRPSGHNPKLGEERVRIPGAGAPPGGAGAVEGAHRAVVGAGHSVRVDVDPGSRQGAGQQNAARQDDDSTGVEEHGPAEDAAGRTVRRAQPARLIAPATSPP